MRGWLWVCHVHGLREVRSSGQNHHCLLGMGLVAWARVLCLPNACPLFPIVACSLLVRQKRGASTLFSFRILHLLALVPFWFLAGATGEQSAFFRWGICMLVLFLPWPFCWCTVLR